MRDLKPHQLELLRYLVARNSPATLSSLDGRNLRPLKAQGLVVELRSGVVPTDTGRARAAEAGMVRPPAESQTWLPPHLDGPRRSRKRNSGATASARAEAILRAVERLDAALPRRTELMVGQLPARGDDVLEALRALARKLVRTS